MRDDLLDWNDELAEAEFDRATRACKVLRATTSQKREAVPMRARI